MQISFLVSVCVSGVGVGGAVYKMLIHDTYSREIVQIVWNADIWPPNNFKQHSQSV